MLLQKLKLLCFQPSFYLHLRWIPRFEQRLLYLHFMCDSFMDPTHSILCISSQQQNHLLVITLLFLLLGWPRFRSKQTSNKSSKTIGPPGKPEGNKTHKVYCAVSPEIVLWVTSMLKCLQSRNEWGSRIVFCYPHSFNISSIYIKYSIVLY
jgi:hypothetical protein